MNDDELVGRLRAHADDLDDACADPVGRSLRDARVRAGSTAVRRRNPALIGSVLALVIVAMAGGAIWRYGNRADTIRVSASNPVSTAGQGPAVTARIEIPDTIVGGQRVEASLVIDNTTEEELTIAFDGCGPKWRIALTNDTHLPSSAFTFQCDAALVVPVGQTRLTHYVFTYETECSAEPANDGLLPTCVGNSLPPLLPGEYRAVLVGREPDALPGIPRPEPVVVQVVAPDPATASTMAPTTTIPTTVSARLEVPDTIESGDQVDAALIIDNNTGADITIPGCGPMWAIVLTNTAHPPDIAFLLPCLPPLVIRTGQTRFPSVLRASYSTCTARPAGGDDPTPPCLDSGPPPLPTGEYQAVVVGLEKDPLPGIPNPEPVNVRIVPTGSTPALSTNPPPTSPLGT